MPDIQPLPARLRRFKRLLLLGGLLILALLGGAWGTLALLRARAQARFLNVGLDGLYDAGSRLDLVGPVPAAALPTVNAADAYRVAFAALPPDTLARGLWPSLPLADPGWPQPTSVLTPEQAAALTAIVARHADMLAALEAADRIPDCVFITDYSNSQAVPVAHLHPLRQCHRILLLRMMLRVHTGDADAALADAYLALRLSARLDADRPMLSYMQQAEIRRDWVLHLAWALPRLDLSDAALAALQAAIAASDRPDGQQRALQYEAIATLQLVAAQYGACERVGLPVIPPAPGHQLPAGDPRHRRYGRDFRDLNAACDVYLALLRMDRMDYDAPERAALHDAVALRLQADLRPDTAYIYPLLAGAFLDVRERRVRSETTLRLADVAITALRYQRRHGRLPADDSELRGTDRQALRSPRFGQLVLVYTPAGFAVAAGRDYFQPGPRPWSTLERSPLSLYPDSDQVWYLEIATKGEY